MRLRPHGRALVLPALALVVTMGVAGFAAASVPPGRYQGWARLAVAVVVLVLVLRAVVAPYLRWRTTTLLVTDRRIVLRKGVLRSTTRDVPLWRVADVVVERSLPQRMFGSGSLFVDATGGRGGLAVHDVPGVERVARELIDLLDEMGPDEDGDDGPDDGSEHGRTGLR